MIIGLWRSARIASPYVINISLGVPAFEALALMKIAETISTDRLYNTLHWDFCAQALDNFRGRFFGWLL